MPETNTPEPVMPQNGCQNCEVFKSCVNGEMSNFVTARREAEELRISQLSSEVAKKHATNALNADKDREEFYLGRLPVHALKGLCKGPTLLRNKCQNPYAKQLLRDRVNF